MKHTFGHVRSAKFRSVCAFAVLSESSLGTFWIAKDAKFIHADKED